MPNLRDEQLQDIYNPKSNPDRAIDIEIRPNESDRINIFLDTKSKSWDSEVNGTSKLSPMQMETFFGTNVYKSIRERVKKDWPLSDDFYRELSEALDTNRLNIGYDEGVEKLDEDGEFRKGNIDKNRSREKNAAGVQKRTNSGRVIVTFSDFGVEKKDLALAYCWPKMDSEFKWSQWNLADKVFDESKSNPLFVRMSFFHAGYEYGLNLSLRKEVDEYRGFFGYNLTLEPKIQWTTPVETEEMLQLGIVQKFLKACVKRVSKYINIPPEEVYEKISNKEKITLDQIKNTQAIIRRNLPLIRDAHSDKFIYT